jgi:hypothetical protein
MTAYGIQSYSNEVKNLYCFGDCYHDDQDNYDVDLLYKVGTNAQLDNTLSAFAMRSLGGEYKLHNLNGLMESLAFSNGPMW